MSFYLKIVIIPYSVINTVKVFLQSTLKIIIIIKYFKDNNKVHIFKFVDICLPRMTPHNESHKLLFEKKVAKKSFVLPTAALI